MARRPLQWAKTLWPVGWSRRVVIMLVMQALGNAIAIRAKKRWFGGGYALATEQNADKSNPTFITAANAAAAWFAQHTGVNPSPTIAALADHAMAQIAPAPVRPAGGPC